MLAVECISVNGKGRPVDYVIGLITTNMHAPMARYTAFFQPASSNVCSCWSALINCSQDAILGWRPPSDTTAQTHAFITSMHSAQPKGLPGLEVAAVSKLVSAVAAADLHIPNPDCNASSAVAPKEVAPEAAVEARIQGGRKSGESPIE